MGPMCSEQPVEPRTTLSWGGIRCVTVAAAVPVIPFMLARGAILG